MSLYTGSPSAPVVETPSTLVITHVEHFYFRNYERECKHEVDGEFLRQVLQHIEQSKRQKQAIIPAVALSYRWAANVQIPVEGIPHPAVAKALRGYERCPEQPVQTWEDWDDQIAQCCWDHDFPTDGFDLIGMYLDRCVCAMAYVLRRKFPASRIRVFTQACLAINADKDHIRGAYNLLNNIELVPAV